MSNRTIWNALRSGGMTAAGAAAMMGNMMAESAMRSNNVQDGMGASDEEYTRNVDNGKIDRNSFSNDQRGYGLCQWTYNARKRDLFEFAVMYGSSIGDESMQVAFCLYELPQEAPDTWKLCCTSDDIYKCTEWICKYYERPAVNNVQERYNFAAQFYNEFFDSEFTEPCESCSINVPEPVEPTDGCSIFVRILRKGDKGRDVYLAQCGLNDMQCYCGVADGIFGDNTLAAVREFRRMYNLNPGDTIDGDMWQVFVQ